MRAASLKRVDFTLTVAADGSGNFASINEALESAPEDATIVVRPGIYREHVVIFQGATVVGDGRVDQIVVAPPDADEPAIFVSASRCEIRGLTVDASATDVLLEGDRSDLLQIVTGNHHVLGMRFVGGDGLSFEGDGTTAELTGCAIQGCGTGIFVGEGATLRAHDNDVSGTIGNGFSIRSSTSGTSLRGNRIRGTGQMGILVDSGAQPLIEENDIWATRGAAIGVHDAGTSPSIRRNRIRNAGSHGVVVAHGATADIEENDLHDLDLSERAESVVLVVGRSNPTIRGNRIFDSKACGISIESGSCPTIHDNEIWNVSLPAVWIADPGTRPVIRTNRIHDAEGNGIVVSKAATPRIEHNEIWNTPLPAIWIQHVGTNPYVGSNRLHDVTDDVVGVDGGACPEITRNEIWGTTGSGIWVGGLGSDAAVSRNRIHDCEEAGIDVAEGAAPRITENDVTESGVGVRIRDVGTAPRVVGNTISGTWYVGIEAIDGPSARIEDNEISNTPGGVHINWQDSLAAIAHETSAVIANNRIHDCDGSGVVIGTGATVWITGNDIRANLEEGIWVGGIGASATIEANHIHMNSEGGIRVEGGSAEIVRNRIHGNFGKPIRADADSSVSRRGNKLE